MAVHRIAVIPLLLLWIGAFLLIDGKSNRDQLVDTVFALKQSNLDTLDHLFWEISDPKSSSYGRHLSRGSITKLVATPRDQVEKVMQWLRSIGGQNIKLRGNGDYISVKLPLHLAHPLVESFNTLKNNHPNNNNNIGSNNNIPNELHSIIEFAFRSGSGGYNLQDMNKQSGVHLVSTSVRKVAINSEERNSIPKKQPTSNNNYYNYNYNNKRGVSGDPNTQKNAYGVPIDLVATNETNLQMVWGTGTFGYLPSDLQQFYDTFNVKGNTNIVSPLGYLGEPGGDNFGEGTLDTTYITSMGLGVTTLVANTNDSQSTEWSIGFGDALLDFTMLLAENSTIPKVLSMSLGSLSWDSCNLLCQKVIQEAPDISYQECYNYLDTQRQVCMYDSSSLMDRINIEFKKIGSRGTTLLAATGDGGSHFSFIPFDNSTLIGSLLNQVSCKYTIPTFPAASPYVLGVGGTQWGNDPSSPVAWYASGGAFSWRFPMPSYQSREVNSYLQQNGNRPNFPLPGTYNSTARAYPDVSALADNIPLVIQGSLTGTGGTSASTPEFAGIISLINDHRLNQGLPTLGFVNPRIYQIARDHPGAAFYDITSGSSSCGANGFCCSTGFPAAEGWDPTTGLGSPLWEGLLEYLGSD